MGFYEVFYGFSYGKSWKIHQKIMENPWKIHQWMTGRCQFRKPPSSGLGAGRDGAGATHHVAQLGLRAEEP